MKIPKRFGNRWDGSSKYYTKDCKGCKFYRELEGDELCGWGVAFKYLVEPKKRKKCEIKNRNFENEWYSHSVEYLDEVIRGLQDGNN